MNGIDRRLSNCSEDSDGATPQTSEAGKYKNSMQIRIQMKDAKTADIVYNAVVVDKEPKRSSATRNIAVDGEFITAEILSPDAKYMHKSASNFFEMSELSRSVVERVGAYKYKEPTAPTNKKKQNKKH